MGREMNWLRYAGPVAALLWIAAVVGFGMALGSYSQLEHPVALLGGAGIERALAFNLLGFVLPGILACVVAVDLRRQLPAQLDWTARIGTQLLFLAALGFIAMGLLPLDPWDLDSQAGRLHAVAWMLWWIAFVPGALLTAIGLWSLPGWRRFALSGLVAAAVVLLAVVLVSESLPAGVAQRLAFVVWFAWMCGSLWWPRAGAATT